MQKLGKGCFGVVLQALDTLNSMKPVAIKVCKGNSSFDKENSKQEAYLLQYVTIRDPKNSSSLIKLLDRFQHKGHDCLVFEWMPGGDLFSYVTRQNNKYDLMDPFETVKPVITMSQIKAIA